MKTKCIFILIFQLIIKACDENQMYKKIILEHNKMYESI